MQPGDGQFIGELAMDSLAQANEHYGEDAVLTAAQVTLAVRDEDGVHLETMSAELVR